MVKGGGTKGVTNLTQANTEHIHVHHVKVWIKVFYALHSQCQAERCS